MPDSVLPPGTTLSFAWNTTAGRATATYCDKVLDEITLLLKLVTLTDGLARSYFFEQP